MAQSKQPLVGRTALVTGASSGLGADFARELAARGADVVVVARREDRLKDLGAEIAAKHGVAVHVVAMSLSDPEAPQALYDRLHAEGRAVDVLVNNAGFGVYGPFLEVPWERELEMLNLDIVALVHLTKLFVRDMVERDSGYVLQVASIGAYQPSPNYGTYAAAKSFVLNFGEALSYELRETNVGVTVVCPGVTRTEFLDVAGQGDSQSLFQRATMMDSGAVARTAVDAMLKRRSSVVPGLQNALPVLGLRFMPRRAMAAMANLAMTMGGGRK